MASFVATKLVGTININKQPSKSTITFDIYGSGELKKTSGHRFVEMLSLRNGTNKFKTEAEILLGYFGLSAFEENVYADLGRYYEPSIAKYFANGKKFEIYTMETHQHGDFVPTSQYETGLPDFVITEDNMGGEIKTLGIITKDWKDYYNKKKTLEAKDAFVTIKGTKKLDLMQPTQLDGKLEGYFWQCAFYQWLFKEYHNRDLDWTLVCYERDIKIDTELMKSEQEPIINPNRVYKWKLPQNYKDEAFENIIWVRSEREKLKKCYDGEKYRLVFKYSTKDEELLKQIQRLNEKIEVQIIKEV